MTQTKRKRLSTRELATIAVLAAVASLLFFLEVPIVLFYKLDFSNLPVLLGTFAMGPVAGSMILLLKSAIGLLHSTSQGVGELADFLMGLAMLLPAGLIYQAKKSRKSAIIGMLVGSVCATVAGVLTNVYILIPFYGAAYHMPVEQIIAMGQTLIPSLDTVWKFVFAITAPFNVLKWASISVLGGLLYKPLSPILHGARRAAQP
ncbi:MAG TPA: ECF transporter S component [Candidatus Limiplasma sp.]|nr:ECF transporter S component [Candidatus Limiplasma sp.]HPS80515.1 ECF transporter S component [Candidatus Limiplasma sp.]